jgi:GDP/UDP-N,N'-diacetylbacillosamine 2-epimerase (hydrolysing)
MNGQQRRRVVYLSGTRADFGLMQASLRESSKYCDLSVLATGMHLDERYGRSLADIEACGLPIFGKVPMDVASRSRAGMALGLSQCLAGVTRVLEVDKPDILMLLGDRDEMLAGAIAALHLGVVTVHVHGGERSGTVDEPMRHAISKLCTFHFVATEQSRERLVRMGERTEHVTVVGAPGLDGLAEAANMSQDACNAALGLPRNTPFLLCLFHPVVQQAEDAWTQTSELLDALHKVNLPVVWIEPNADAGSGDILRALGERGLPAHSVQFKNIPRQVFVSAMRHCAAMVGNSSAGIIEAASLATPVVNIGDRQRLRERSQNVQDVTANSAAILHAIRQALTQPRPTCENVYGDGQTASRIALKLAELEIPPSLLEKYNTY